MSIKKWSLLLGTLSLLAFVSYGIAFFFLSGPNFNEDGITIFLNLSSVGILLALLTLWVGWKYKIGLVLGLVGSFVNLITFACTLLLMFAFGISES